MSTKVNVCEKCHNEFPYQMVIDGKLHKFQHRRFCLECSPFGAKNNRDLARTEKVCARCGFPKPLGDFHARGIGQHQARYPYCKPCMLEYNTEYRANNKLKAIRYLGGCCQECGYKKCLSALQFHHRDSEEKEKNIGHWKVPFETMKPELEKCTLLCANCHLEIHSAPIQFSLLTDPAS